MLTRYVNRGSTPGGNGTTNETSGANRAFASLFEANTELAGDYTGETPATVSLYGHDFENIALQIVCDMGSPRSVEDNTTNNIILGGTWVLDATHWVLIRAADGTVIGGQATNESRHLGVFDAGYKITGNDNRGQVEVDSPYMIFLDLEVESTDTGGFGGAWEFVGDGAGSVGVNLLGTGDSSEAFYPGPDTKFVNCIGKSASDEAYVNPGFNVDGSRFYNCASIDAGGHGFDTRLGDATVAKNCWSFGSTNDDFSNFAAPSTNNASEDGTAPGASPQTGLVATADADFVDYAGGDYAPALGGKLEGNGADLSADVDYAFAFDITGAVRTQWDIGPFAYSAGGGGPGVSITNADDEVFMVDESITITGANFEAAQGTGRVVISPADDIDDAGAVAQTVDSWADGAIDITVVRSALAFDTQMYLFIENDTGDSNASGYSVQFEPRVTISETLEDETGSTVVSETDIKASVWRNREPTGAPDQELTGLATDGAGLLEFDIGRGALDPTDPVYLLLHKDDAVNWAATAVKLVPTYS